MHESMVLTTSSGKLELDEIVKSVNAIYPDGKGGMCKAPKDVFPAEEEMIPVNPDGGAEEEDDWFAAMEAIAENIQNRQDHDEEEALEAYESYADIRRRLQEQKTGRGYFKGASKDKGKGKGIPVWQFSGSVQGRMEQLKQRTKCHLCKRIGHWQRECPMRQTAGAASSSAGNKEVLMVEFEDPKALTVWEAFMTEEVARDTSEWKHRRATDVLNSGFA